MCCLTCSNTIQNVFGSILFNLTRCKHQEINAKTLTSVHLYTNFRFISHIHAFSAKKNIHWPCCSNTFGGDCV